MMLLLNITFFLQVGGNTEYHLVSREVNVALCKTSLTSGLNLFLLSPLWLNFELGQKRGLS